MIINLKDCCIVNFASPSKGSERYIHLQNRLVESLDKQGYEGWISLAQDERWLGCPLHQDVPYAFKAFMLKKACELGYRYVLWLDSSVWAIRPLDIIFEHIAKVGYLLFDNGGWMTGQWCSDKCLEVMHKTREEAFLYPHLMAIAMGFDFTQQVCHEFLRKYYDLAVQGDAFKGSWTNKNQEVSMDHRVLGHRHDQTVASFLTWDLGMRNWVGNFDVFLSYKDLCPKNYVPKDTVVFMAQG